MKRDADGRCPLDYAREVAEEVKAGLAPACYRIEIVGSIRRQRPRVKDPLLGWDWLPPERRL